MRTDRSGSSEHGPNTPKNTAWQNWDLSLLWRASCHFVDEWSIPKYQYWLLKLEWPRKHAMLQISRLYCLRFCHTMFDRQPSLLGLGNSVLHNCLKSLSHSGQSPCVYSMHSFSPYPANLGDIWLIFKDRNYDISSYLDGRKTSKLSSSLLSYSHKRILRLIFQMHWDPKVVVERDHRHNTIRYANVHT